jgi:Fe2+ or Zn2+ uptake regulation protein
MTTDNARTRALPQSQVAAFNHLTRQREAILRALSDHPGFVSAQTLHIRLCTDGGRIGLSTVYRNLRALARAGPRPSIPTTNPMRRDNNEDQSRRPRATQTLSIASLG